MVLMFVGWLIARWCVSLVTASKYLVGVRTVNLLRGAQPGNLRPEIVMSVLRGRAMEENTVGLKAPMLAVTIPVLKLIKALLTKSNMGLVKKRVM